MEANDLETRALLRRLNRLMTWAAAMLTVLTLGLGAAALYGAVMLVRVHTGQTKAQQAAAQAAEQLDHRQEEAAAAVAALAHRSQSELDTILEQRKKLEPMTQGGPIAKADTALRTMSLMADEVGVLSRNLLAMEAVAAHQVRPLPAEKNVAQARRPPAR